MVSKILTLFLSVQGFLTCAKIMRCRLYVFSKSNDYHEAFDNEDDRHLKESTTERRWSHEQEELMAT